MGGQESREHLVSVLFGQGAWPGCLLRTAGVPSPRDPFLAGSFAVRLCLAALAFKDVAHHSADVSQRLALALRGARGTASPAEDPLPAGAGAQPLLAAVRALLLLSPALTSPEKLAFIVSQSERVRSPPRGNGTSPLLLSLAVGNWGIFIFFSLLFEFLQGPGAEGAMLPCTREMLLPAGLEKTVTYAADFKT